MEGGKKAVLSLEPVAEALWCTHGASGARFKISHLDPARDEALGRECTRADETLDRTAFSQKVGLECIKDWEGIGDKSGVLLPCNPENIVRFMNRHALTIGLWVIVRARDMQHFRQEELDAAKKD